jgi:DNA gyrase subunit A
MIEFAEPQKPELGAEYEEPYPHFLAVSQSGMALRFTLWPHRDPSTRSGRLFGKLKDNDEFIEVFKVYAEDQVCALSAKGKLLCCDVMDVNLLAGPGRGVTLIKLDDKDKLVGAWSSRHTVEVNKSSGGTIKLTETKATVTNRGGKGRPIMKRGTVESLVYPPLETPDFEAGAKRLVDMGYE